MIYCRVWRWPDLQSHHELKVQYTCQINHIYAYCAFLPSIFYPRRPLTFVSSLSLQSRRTCVSTRTTTRESNPQCCLRFSCPGIQSLLRATLFFPINRLNNDTLDTLPCYVDVSVKSWRNLPWWDWCHIMQASPTLSLSQHLEWNLCNSLPTFAYSILDFNDGKQPFHLWTNGEKPS